MAGVPPPRSTAPEIRLLSRGDLDAAFALSSTAGWNQRAEDWRMLLDLAPHGAFAAVWDGRVVGTAIGIDYRGFGWIAMMLVEPSYRGRGIGRRLLEAAVRALPAGVAVRLDATPLGRPLYESYGFREEATLTRHLAAAGDLRVSPDDSAAVEAVAIPMTAAHLPDVAVHDRLAFGGVRAAVLGWALNLAPGCCHTVWDGKALAGYALGRQGRLSDQIGPVVAASDAAARALVGASIRGTSAGTVIIDVFDAAGTFGEWLRACGFQPQRPLFRMCRTPGAPPVAAASGSRLVERAILGPEFA